MVSRARKTPSAGSKPDKLIRDALMVALKREAKAANGQPTKKLALMAEALVEKACQGDVQAIKEVADRVDGRPAQALEHSGEIAGAVDEIQVILVDIDGSTRGLNGRCYGPEIEHEPEGSSALPNLRE